MHGQHVGQRLHGRIERHAIALVFKQRIQATEHQRRPRITVLLHPRVLLVIGPWIDRLLIAIAGVTRSGITPVIHLVNGTTSKGQTQGQQG